jgi:hypothetical protein
MSMLVTVLGFGTIWERRSTGCGVTGRARASYYNTTGIPVNGKVHYRWTTGGKIRFNSVGGFDPDYPMRSVGRVYECGDVANGAHGWKQLLFRKMLPCAERPDFFLFVLTSRGFGSIHTRSSCWRAESVNVIAVSEHRRMQEAMVLMPPYSWIRTELGTWFAEPSGSRCWIAELMLSTAS